MLSLGAGLGFSVLVAIGLTILDLYRSGHGERPLNSPWLDWSAAGVHLSVADVIFLAALVLGAAVAWRRASRRDA